MTRIGLPPTGGIRSVLPFLGPLGEAVDAAIASGDETVPVEQTRLGPPIPDPPNLFNCGANYFAHLIEHGLDTALLPTLPVMFMKPISALSGPTDAIVRPRECRQLDYEAELAIVIGKAGRRIPADRAADHIAGYMITNGVIARPLVVHRGRVHQLRSHPYPDLVQRRAAPGRLRQGDDHQPR